ncbi:hypothetical protein [Streptomyces sp. NPDC088554]|uniref:hypothetical protein n=1 Tax=Streptomyces sp. NPDC088554 TaxID=3365865 RepID=UPI0038055F76
MTDESLWGIVALIISFLALVFGILYALTWQPEPAPLPPLPPDRSDTYTYTCHCHRTPATVTIRLDQIPRRQAIGHWMRESLPG